MRRRSMGLSSRKLGPADCQIISTEMVLTSAIPFSRLRTATSSLSELVQLRRTPGQGSSPLLAPAASPVARENWLASREWYEHQALRSRKPARPSANTKSNTGWKNSIRPTAAAASPAVYTGPDAADRRDCRLDLPAVSHKRRHVLLSDRLPD